MLPVIFEKFAGLYCFTIFFLTKMMMLIFCHCNVFISLFSASVLPVFKERIFQGAPFSDCFQI